jgi:hypothetical protein
VGKYDYGGSDSMWKLPEMERELIFDTYSKKHLLPNII